MAPAGKTRVAAPGHGGGAGGQRPGGRRRAAGGGASLPCDIYAAGGTPCVSAYSTDTGNAHMNAIYWGSACWFGGCTGSGPWVEADLENGMYSTNTGTQLIL